MATTLAPANISAAYALLGVIVLFSVWSPDIFFSTLTIKNVLNTQAVTAIVALSLVVPLACAVFDLSVGYTLGVCAILVAKLLAGGMSPGLAIAITIAVAVVIGIINGIVVVVMKIDSFIGTLATGALLAGTINMISEQPIAAEQLLGDFGKVANAEVLGVTLPVIYVLLATIVLVIVLEHMPVGRRIYATGYSLTTARLSGIRTDRLRFTALIVSATLAGIAGILVAARTGNGSPTVGPPYLLPAFAAAFVGATQLRNGRFNPVGTVLAVLLLGTGAEGLADVNAPPWGQTVFQGLALLAAVGFTGYQRRRSESGKTKAGMAET